MPITNFDKAELLLPMTGANSGTTFTDYSLRRRIITNSGVITSTAQSAFAAYGSSGFFGTGNNVLSVAGTANIFSLNQDRVFLSVWFRTDFTDTANLQYLAANRPASGQPWWQLYMGSSAGRTVNFSAVNSAGSVILDLTSGSALSNATWYNLRLYKNAAAWEMYIGSTLEASGNQSETFGTTTNALTIGRTESNTSRHWRGHMQDFVIDIGGTSPPTGIMPRLTQRTLTRASTGIDSHQHDRAVLFDWNGSQNTVGHTGGGFILPDSEGDFVADDLIDLEYGVAFIKDGCGPICRGPVEVDPDT